MNKLNSEEGMPESVRSYFYCFNNEIEEIHYLPYIKYPLHGCVVFEIGGPKLRRIHCNYRGDTLRGNAYLYIYVDSTMPKEQFDLLMNDIQTHFEFHKVLKGKYSIFVKDCNSKAVIWSFKH